MSPSFSLFFSYSDTQANAVLFNRVVANSAVVWLTKEKSNVDDTLWRQYSKNIFHSFAVLIGGY